MPTIFFDCLSIKGGGGATIVSRLIFGFAQEGWNVHVILVDEGLRKTLAAGAKFGVTLHFRPSLASQVKCLAFRHIKFRTLASSVGADVVFSLNYWTPWDGIQITYHVNATPFFSAEKVRKLVGPVRAFIQPLYSRFAIYRSTANFFESNYLLKLAIERHGHSALTEATVHYIGVDLPSFRPERKNFKPRMISITSGAAHKRNDLVLQLHRQMNKKGLGVELVFGGNESAIRESLNPSDIQYIAQSGSVSFLGFMSRERIYQELSNSTALVSCSEVESFFMVPVEAMGVGCPVICSNCTSLKESVGAAGIVCEPGDLESMEKKFVELMDEDVRAEYSARSFSWAKKFHANKCSEQIVEAVSDIFEHQKKVS